MVRMKKAVIAVIILALVVLVALLMFLPSNNVDMVKENTLPKTELSGSVITIVNFAFSPATITIESGTTVTWINEDSVGHTVTSDSGSELDSPLLKKSEVYTHTFNTPGTYQYYCAPHPAMKGTIIVQ